MTNALYPDSLVTQILAASTFPEQVVAADRWVQSQQGKIRHSPVSDS
jgi:hypothetical protein